jgi:hypothetical protein
LKDNESVIRSAGGHGGPPLQPNPYKNNVEDEKDNTLFVDIGFVLCFGSSTLISICLVSKWQAEDVGVYRQFVEAHAVL